MWLGELPYLPACFKTKHLGPQDGPGIKAWAHILVNPISLGVTFENRKTTRKEKENKPKMKLSIIVNNSTPFHVRQYEEKECKDKRVFIKLLIVRSAEPRRSMSKFPWCSEMGLTWPPNKTIAGIFESEPWFVWAMSQIYLLAGDTTWKTAWADISSHRY